MHRFSRDRWLHEKVAPDPSSPFSSRPLLSSAKLSFRDNRSKTMFLEIDQRTKIEIRNLGHRDAYPRLLCAVHCALEDERGEAKTKLLFNPWALRRTLFDIGFHTGCVWRRRLFVEGDRREREREERSRKSRYQTRRQLCFGIYNSCHTEYMYVHVYKLGGESGTVHL